MDTSAQSIFSAAADYALLDRRQGSNVVPLLLPNGSQIRLGRLVGLYYMSDSRVIDTDRFYNTAAAFLAYKHFNERRGDVLPALPGLLDQCDFYWTFDFRDTQGSGLEAVRQLTTAMSRSTEEPTAYSFSIGVPPQATTAPSQTPQTRTGTRDINGSPRQTGGGRKRTRRQREEGNMQLQQSASSPPQHITSLLPSLDPFAIYGAHWSSESRLTSILSGAWEIPQISGVSTSADLDDNLFFARTVATNDGDAHAAILYYHNIGVTYLACLYIKDSWGVNYHASLQKYAQQYDIQLVSFPYDHCCVESAILQLAQSGHGHVYAVMHDWRQVLIMAHDHGIIGRPEYAWMGAEEKKWTGDAFFVVEPELAQALHGIGTVNMYFEPVPAWEEALKEIAFNPALQQEFVSIQADPTLFDGYNFPHYVPTGFTHSIFDAVMALGLNACNVSGTGNDSSNKSISSHALPPLFTGPEFYQKLVETTAFDGVSGQVSFDPITGTRNQNGVRYSVENILLSEARTTEGAYRFESKLVAVIGGNEWMDHRTPFVFFDNTNNVPPSLPPIDGGVELHLVSSGAQAVGYALASIVVAASLGFLVWTIWNRNIFVVRAAQPIFLGQLCIGTLVMAVSVFPASLPGASTSQGPDRGMDIACSAQLWLVTLGFVTAFSAIFR
jgi:Receptor family ligand binding region/7 transmembrane sweet-taste receptor of 3 GCPR